MQARLIYYCLQDKILNVTRAFDLGASNILALNSRMTSSLIHTFLNLMKMEIEVLKLVTDFCIAASKINFIKEP